jgi:hypothetical protein
MDRFPKVKEYTPYAGIGSTKTPDNICKLMGAIAYLLYRRGYILRSGGAEGADDAFEKGTPVMAIMEIFLPWNRYNGKPDTMRLTSMELGVARSIAEKYHPNWLACSEGAKKLHTRNTMQILGRGCNSPVKFVICWTPDGKNSGGTGQALRIAEDKKIKVYNLHDPGTRMIFYDLLGWKHDL